MERLTAAAIKEDAMTVLKAQLLGSDIFGWGDNQPQASRYVATTQADWPAHFSNLKVRAEARYSIRRAYLLDGPVPIKRQMGCPCVYCPVFMMVVFAGFGCARVVGRD